VITLLADRNIPYLSHFIHPEVNLVLFDPEERLPGRVSADALIVRTVTRINKETLPKQLGKTLRFVATASAGTDHLDLPFLEKKGIHVASAAGCNARAVAEYVATALLHWCYSNDESIKRTQVGIIGLGHTGSAVDQLLRKIGYRTLLHDPPRKKREKSFDNSYPKSLIQCDVLTFHVPLIDVTLTPQGYRRTRNWLNEERIRKGDFRLVINASRGGVVDERAVKDAYITGDLNDYIFDVWEREPSPAPAVIEDAWLATPHIAGYSIQAKVRATSMVCEALHHFFSISFQPEPLNLDDLPSFEKVFEVERKLDEIANMRSASFPESLLPVLETIHPMFGLSARLKQSAHHDEQELRTLFTRLRTREPLRNEYHTYRIPERILSKFPVLEALTSL